MIQMDSFEETLQCCGVLIYGNKGNSMFPLIKEGRDKVIIVPKGSGRLKKYEVPLYRRDNGKYVLHRVMKVRAADYLICGDNRSFLEPEITDSHIIGVMSGVIRKGKTIEVTDWRYRLYVALWCWTIPFFIRRVFLKIYSVVLRLFR